MFAQCYTFFIQQFVIYKLQHTDTRTIKETKFIIYHKQDIVFFYFGMEIQPVSYTHLDVYKRQT